jgi:hypothetical protein
LATVYVGIQSDEPFVGRPILDVAFDNTGNAYVVPVMVRPVGRDAYWAAARLELLSSGSPAYRVNKIYADEGLSRYGEQFKSNPREIGIDRAGNVYVVNVHCGGSDSLWKYTPDGAVFDRDLSNAKDNHFVYDPIAMHLSDRTEMLYLASARPNPDDSDATVIKGFSTETLASVRNISVDAIQHVTAITEDPTTGTLWVVGFTIKGLRHFSQIPVLRADVAKIRMGAANATAMDLAYLGCTDVEVPTSILWTGDTGLGRADIDDDDAIDLNDLVLLARRWNDTGCAPPDWCGGCDLNPPLLGTGRVDFADLLVLSNGWLRTTDSQ